MAVWNTRKSHLKKTILSLSLLGSLCFTSHPALAQSSNIGSKLPAELQKLYDCRTVADPIAKAGCYDLAMDAFDSARQSGEIATVTRQEIQEVQKESFGFNIPSLPKIGSIFGGGDKSGKTAKAKDAKFDQLVSPILSVSNNGAGKMRFNLENGQIWVQTSNSTLAAKRIMRKDVKDAHIQRAALGSFKLQVNGKGPSVKVRRTK